MTFVQTLGNVNMTKCIVMPNYHWLTVHIWSIRQPGSSAFAHTILTFVDISMLAVQLCPYNTNFC